MKISELIYHLEILKKTHGDVECFVNGEFGIDDQQPLEENFIYHGNASLLMDYDDRAKFRLEDNQPIVAFAGHELD